MHFYRLKRREFLALLGGLVAAWPTLIRAQQSVKLPIIGFLGANSPEVQSQWTAAFVQRLHELGWTEGRNVAIEYRWAETRFERAPDFIAEFVRLKVDVIVTHATANALAAKRGTSVIPIVFAAQADPVGTGLVESLARPGGNVTGMSNQFIDAAGKRVELLHEAVPTLRRLAILANGSIANTCAGDRRDQGGGANAWHRGYHVRRPSCGRHRARIRRSQGSSRGYLRVWRPAYEHQPESNRRIGPRSATADGGRVSGIR
jgi:hypothetical protein